MPRASTRRQCSSRQTWRSDPLKTVRLRIGEAILVCGKCLKRHPDGKAIRRALKAQAKAGDGKIVRTSCLGICPKNAVVVASQAGFAGGRAILVRAPASADEALRALSGVADNERPRSRAEQ